MVSHPIVVALLLSLVVFGSSGATDSPAAEAEPDQSTSMLVASRSDYAASQSTAGAMSIPPTVVTVFAVVGGVVVALVGAGAIAAIILSLFGMRMCYILGTCHDPYGFIGSTPYEMPYPAYPQIPYPTSTYHAKSSDGSGNELPQYDAYSQVSYPTGYQKRSLEYVGPILKALGSAYEQSYSHQYYGQQNSGQHLPGTPRKTSELTSSTPTETNHNPDK